MFRLLQSGSRAQPVSVETRRKLRPRYEHARQMSYSSTVLFSVGDRFLADACPAWLALISFLQFPGVGSRLKRQAALQAPARLNGRRLLLITS
jgi:hypothetical protein